MFGLGVNSDKKRSTSSRAEVDVGFWGSRKVDPYELIIKKVASQEFKRDRSIHINVPTSKNKNN